MLWNLLSMVLIFSGFRFGAGQTLKEASEEAIKWRRIAAELQCQCGDMFTVQKTGGWCLKPEAHPMWLTTNPIYGKGASNHVPPDEGLAAAISEHLLEFSKGKNLTLYDIGAGIGQFGRYFDHFTPKVMWKGFDGAGNVESFTKGYVKWIDVTSPLFDTIPDTADWIMSLEVGEHIPPETTENFLDLLDKHNRYGILLSWAVPRQPGHGHINCRSNHEIAEMLAKRGYVQTEWATTFQRTARTKALHPWFKKTFMVFIKKSNQ